MRIRTIKPEFWAHPVMAKQSDSTKLMAIGLLNVADDDGYFFADPRMIRNAIRPLDDDSRITTVSILELSEIGYIQVRNHATHGDIGFIPSFKNHQVINKPKASKIKAFFDDATDTVSIPDPYRLEGKGTGSKGTRKGADISCPISSDESEILKLIWDNAPKVGRERSSKKELMGAWKKTPSTQRPNCDQLQSALNAWNASKKWQTGYAEGIHLWVQNQQWENLPEPMESTPKSTHATRSGYKDEELNDFPDL
jgi:hypothetical protein